MILEQNPQRRGVHYRLGRLFLTKAPPEKENAKKEIGEELKIDPASAASEFLLGEIARQSGQWDEAIGHFQRATKLDEGFIEAYLALGMSINSVGKFAEVVPNMFHGESGDHALYLVRRRWDYFVRYLLGVTPPANFEIRDDREGISPRRRRRR